MPQFENYPFKNPALYAPGQIAFNNNAEMSQLLTMFAGGVLPGIVGQGNFMPSMLPSQNIMDQFAAKQYQAQTRMSDMAIAGSGNDDVAKRLLGMRTMFTREAASDMNRSQAAQMASFINNPMLKGVAGMMVGPENLEAILHGRRGDVAALNQSVNRIGYFRADPSGHKRMDADSLANFSQGMYAHLYDPGGNFDQLTAGANAGERDSISQLQSIAKTQESVVDNEEGATRIAAQLSPSRISSLYEKHISGGETDTAAQARALTKMDSAIHETGVLETGQMSVDRLVKLAKNSKLGETHGFMAGQMGQLTEHLFQRGMLPESIGAMSPAERVNLLQKEGPDDATLDRLTREYGHRDLMKRPEYASGTQADRDEMLNTSFAGYREKLQATMSEIKKTDTDRKSPQELEKLAGFDTLAGNVDAKRGADTVKKYAGAVAAVRDIFGDNGNPNAPMPALLAALEQLSGGASAQMDPKKIEAAVRQMQTTAKEAGVGFEQLATMSAQMQAMGDMLGVSKTTTMQNQVNAMAMVKTMRDTGAFASPVFGAMSQGEATQAAAMALQQGEASDNARTMAALADIYNTAPEAFAGTEFSLAMEAYNNPESGGDYMTPEGRKNVQEIVGRGGPQGLLEIYERGGGSLQQFNTRVRDPNSMRSNVAGTAFQTQRYEVLRDISNSALLSPTIAAFRGAAKADPQAALAQYDAQQLASLSSDVMAQMILDTGGMKPADQVAHVQEKITPALQREFEASLGVDETRAKELAESATLALIGEDKDGQQKLRVSDYISKQSGFVYSRYGRAPAAAWQMWGEDRPQLAQRSAAADAVVAQRKAEIGMGYAGHPFARVADYFLEMGEKGTSVTFAGMAEAFGGFIKNDDIAGRAFAGVKPGLDALFREMEPVTVTHKYVEELARNKDYANLKKLARVREGAAVIDDAAFKAEHEASVAEALADPEKVSQLYTQFRLGDPTRTNTDEKRAALRAHGQFMADQEELTRNKHGAGALTESQLVDQAKARGLSQARPTNTPEENKKAEELSAVRNALLDRRPEVRQAAAEAALRLAGVDDVKENGETLSSRITRQLDIKSPDAEKDAAHAQELARLTATFPSEAAHIPQMLEAIRGTAGLAEIGIDTSQLDRVVPPITPGASTPSTINLPAGAAPTAATPATGATNQINAPAGQALPQTGAVTTQQEGTPPAAAAVSGAAASTTNATQAAPQPQPQPKPTELGGGGDKKIEISGTLNFQGTLESAVLAAVDRRMNDVPGNGMPVPR